LRFPTFTLLAGIALALFMTACEPTGPREAQAVTVTVTDPVHVTRTGERYHQAGCRYLDGSDFVESRTDALRQGLTPCSVCEKPLRVEQVYVTKTGDKFHKFGCQYLRNGSTPETREQAVRDGLTPCSVCGG